MDSGPRIMLALEFGLDLHSDGVGGGHKVVAMIFKILMPEMCTCALRRIILGVVKLNPSRLEFAKLDRSNPTYGREELGIGPRSSSFRCWTIQLRNRALFVVYVLPFSHFAW